jgi:hypothetical protein
MAEGYIYCLSNPSMPGLLKIGMTERTPEKRAEELFTTGVATPFKVEFSRKVENARCTEKEVHKLLDNYRVPNREFFEVTVEDAEKVIDTYLAESIPVFLTVEDVLRSDVVTPRDKTRMIECLKKNEMYKIVKDTYESLTGIEKEKFYTSMFSKWEATQKFTENTTIMLKNDKTLVYKVNPDRTIHYVKSLKTSDYWSVSLS